MNTRLRRDLLATVGALCLAASSGAAFAEGAGDMGNQQAPANTPAGRAERRQQLEQDRQSQRNLAHPDRYAPAQVDRRDGRSRQDDDTRRDRRGRGEDRHDGPPRWTDDHWRERASPDPYRRHVYVEEHRHRVHPDRRRVYGNVVVLRPYGGWYPGYGRYYSDRDAYRWLGLTAITFGLLSYLNESQQRALESAQIAATAAPVGEPIAWYDQGAQGTVVATREGWSDNGRYCREFRQTVEIGGRIEQAYGTACQQPDGAWLVTSR